jgi:hypothetical protein
MMDEDQITQLAVSFKTHGFQLVHTHLDSLRTQDVIGGPFVDAPGAG